MDNFEEISAILNATVAGQELDAPSLLPMIYEELRVLAASQLAAQAPNHTLQPTALVHEVWLRVGKLKNLEPPIRREFFAFASKIMRNVLVDHARGKNRQKRGGGQVVYVTSSEAVNQDATQPLEILDLDHALTELAHLSKRQAKIVELRFFGGFSIEETGFALNISHATVERDWRFARAWLRRKLSDSSAMEN